MTALRKKKKYTPEDYLTLERQAEEKSEYHEGEIVKRANNDVDHVKIMGNLLCELISIIRPEKAEVFSCGLKVKSSDSDYFLYPDLLILCEEPIFYDKEKDVILNPTIIIEIFSKDTALFDRNDKFIIYQQFESIKEVILVNQHKPIIEKFFRLDNEAWSHQAAIGLKEAVKFESVKAEVKLEKIYHQVKVSKSIYEPNKRTPRKEKINESAADD